MGTNLDKIFTEIEKIGLSALAGSLATLAIALTMTLPDPPRMS